MKTLNKITLAMVTAGVLLAGNATAGEKVKIYGKVNATIQSDDDGSNRETDIQSNASRIGVKGGIKVSDSLTAIYQLEWEVDVSDNDDDSEKDNIKARSQWVGLKGDFGSVMLGRNDTALKKAQGKVDLFNDLDGDVKQLFSGDNRLEDTLTYISPSMNGFKFRGTYIAEEGNKYNKNGTSLAIMYGDSKLKKSKVFASIARDTDVKGLDVTRVAVQGKLGDVKLGAMWNESEKSSGGSKGDGFLVSAAYKIGKTTLKAQYQDSDDKNSKKHKDGKSTSIGVDYKLAKNVKVFGFYTDFSFDDNSESSHLGLGMEYKF